MSIVDTRPRTKENRMNSEQKMMDANLTEARRWLNANGLFRFELTVAERARRVAEYARQVATTGRITAWLPPAQPRVHRPRSRWADGDELGRRIAQ